MKRLIAITLVLAACEEHGTGGPQDAPNNNGNEGTVIIVDAAQPPAADASPAIAMACAAACDKLATCSMMPPSNECNMGCEEDLVDCTSQQVMDVQNCAALACGTGDPDMSPVVQCLEMIACINP